jgi:hypothetical protein
MSIKQRVMNTVAAVVVVGGIATFTVTTTKQSEQIKEAKTTQDNIVKETSDKNKELAKQIDKLKADLEKDKADLNAAKHLSDQHGKDIEALKK